MSFDNLTDDTLLDRMLLDYYESRNAHYKIMDKLVIWRLWLKT